jgi:hypothetical protein
MSNYPEDKKNNAHVDVERGSQLIAEKDKSKDGMYSETGSFVRTR